MKHLLTIRDLSAEEITALLNKADQLKYENKHNIPHPVLRGKTLGMIFQKASTRTRTSFEVGMFQLGGHALFLSAGDLQIGRGEPIEDTARTLGRYVDGVMIRTYRQSDAEALAAFSGVPVINGLTDYAHPCQILADLMTIREYKKSFKGLKLCYIGDGNNVANSLIAGAVKLGIQIAAACPAGYRPDPAVTEYGLSAGLLTVTADPLQAAAGADVLYTDVWASMGQEGEAQDRDKVFKGYQINGKILAAARPAALVLHCLPAKRGREITAEVFEAHAREIFDQAENRLHAQKAVLAALMGGGV